jgi:hypothetical protein
VRGSLVRLVPAVWNGNRGLWQRVLEIALWGPRDEGEAMELVKGELGRVVVKTVEPVRSVRRWSRLGPKN